MKSNQVTVICADMESALVQLENRSSPSFCVQGDTLISLAAIAHKNAKIWVENEGEHLFPDEMLDAVVYLSNKLVSMVITYNEIAGRVGNESLKPLKIDGLYLLDF